jgi:hypothetical protein
LEEQAKSQVLLWSAPECPNRVTIPAVILNEIRIQTVEAFYSVPRGGVEIGGVFFGVRTPDGVHIQAFRPIRCEYSTGPSFNLSVRDQLGLAGLLDAVATDPDLAGMTTVGWYHSHTRSDIFLSPNDLQLYSEFFPEQWQIAMILRPANLQPTRAALFFRDRKGVIKSDSPVKQFVIDPPGLGLPELDPAAQAAIPKVTPISAKPAPKPPAETKPVLESSAGLTNLTPASAVASDSTVAVTAATPIGPGAIRLEQALEDIPITQAVPTIGLRSFDLAETNLHRKRSHSWLWVFAVIIALAGGAAGMLAWTKMNRSPDLGLETYDINGAFLIRWDRESSVIHSAASAKLEIQDGNDKTSIDLTPAALAVGGFGYMRRTSQVSVHMTVDGSEPAQEYSNFSGAQALGSKSNPDAYGSDGAMYGTTGDKAHLATQFLNESMQTAELRREIDSLRQQLAEERARKKQAP